MHISTSPAVSPRITGTDQHKRRRTSALLLTLDDHVEDYIVIASIRESVRLFGIDRVRGL